MHFWNIRRNFATNSSSSHSMIVVDDASTLSEIKEDFENEFGWDNFTLKSTKDKKRYLRALFASSLETASGFEASRAVLKDLGLLEDHASDFDPNTPNPQDIGDVDHQSVINLPLAQDGSGASFEFAKDFANWVLSPNVVILGGNDNEDDHPDAKKGWQVLVSSWLAEENLVAFKDESQNTWSLFSQKNGLTLRFSFDDPQQAYVAHQERFSEKKSTRPNLVDVKITDKCPYQCEYCYQGSTPKGEHAPLSVVYDIAQSLSASKVFEVAIGGGEPTLHPDFEHIIDVFKKAHITPNFTTRNLNYLNNVKNQATLSKVGGIAVSVDDVEQTKKVIDVITQPHLSQINISAQVVVGAQSEDEFKQIISLLFKKGIKVTFLGFKTTGFGEGFLSSNSSQVEQAQENWIDWVKEIHDQLYATQNYKPSLWLSVDTALAQVCDEKFKEIDKNQRMYHRTEGTTSMYIDAVQGKMAPSSFCEDIYDLNDNWLKTYQEFSSEKPKKKIALKLR